MVGAVLHLCGHAYLASGGTHVVLQRKGLALLGYLALEGATSRERLADLLWGHEDSANNLRVELHRLRTALQGVVRDAFPRGEDPLNLPESIVVAPIDDPDDLLAGLEDVSPGFADWLASQRSARSGRANDAHVRTRLVSDLARSVRPPHVILLRGDPESGRETVARALARQIGLPIAYGANGPGAAVHFVSESEPFDAALARRILEDKQSVWILACSPYESDGRLILEIRANYPASRLKHVTLAPITWPEARQSLLADLRFEEAARFYLFSGGHLGFLSELLAARPVHEAADPLPMPQRIRATFLLKAQRLGEAALEAAQQLAVHPGPIPAALLDAFGAEPHLDRLESLGWLQFDGGYRFTTEAGRRALYESMAPGQRRRAHERAANALAGTESAIAAAYHREMSGGRASWTDVSGHCPAWAEAVLAPDASPVRALRVPVRTCRPSRELALLSHDGHGASDRVPDGTISWWRLPTDSSERSAEFDLPDRQVLLSLTVRAYVDNPAGIGLHCDAVPLQLTLRGSTKKTVVWADVESPTDLPDGTLVLPLRPAFAQDFIVDHHIARLESRAFAGVIEADLALHEVKAGLQGASGPGNVSAINLT